MLRLDYTQLDQPPIRLSLVRVQSGYIVWDQRCRFYVLAPSSLEFCLRFMRAGVDKGDWLIDDASVERATWHSVRVPDGLSERVTKGRGSSDPDGLLAAGTVPVVARSESPSNVVPIRKGA